MDDSNSKPESKPETNYLSDGRLSITEAPCLRCASITETFLGRVYCDACIADLERIAQNRRDSLWRSDLEHMAASRGVLRPATLHTTFASSYPEPEQNVQAWEDGRNWDGKRNVYIYGPPGTGKSHLARCMLRRETDWLRTVGEITGHQISTLSAYKPEVIANWAWPGVLLIDDVDKGHWGPLGVSILWELLDQREQADRRTILTANASPKVLRDYLLARSGDNKSLVPAALDRLRTRHGRVIVLELTGESLRGRGEA